MRVAQMTVRCSWGAVPIGGVDEADVFRVLPKQERRSQSRRKTKAVHGRPALKLSASDHVSSL
jgi:hypothetical protein